MKKKREEKRGTFGGDTVLQEAEGEVLGIKGLHQLGGAVS